MRDFIYIALQMAFAESRQQRGFCRFFTIAITGRSQAALNVFLNISAEIRNAAQLD